MILKGSKRGGAVDLGKHLLKPENEHIEIHEIRGFVADNVVDAFKEAQAISRGTKCRKFLFSLSLSPPEAENVPVKAFEDAIETIEAKLGLNGQPRVIVFHEKEGRRHAHCVWSRITDLAVDMETMRGLKLSADFYIQSYSGLERKLGKDAAASVESYCDVKIYAGLTSYARAKHVSDMLAEATIRRQDYSFGSDATDINVSSKELGRRVMTPDEILAMPRNEAWVFVRGMRPLRLTMTHYGTVTPWRDEVAANPLEGTTLKGDEAFRIVYPATTDGKVDPKGKPTIEGVTYPQTGAATKRRRFVAPVRLRHLAWLPPLLALWLVDVPAWGTPHLRFSATYTGTAEHRFYRRCNYVGLHPRAVHPADGRCPLVLFFPAN